MTVVYSDFAIADLVKMDESVKLIFFKACEALGDLPPCRHMRHGLPYLIKEVGQGRIVYDTVNGEVQIYRCFATHDRYEKWYKSYRGCHR